ncbi:MAG TPA: hypothetical protein VKR56_16560 [Candidatus Cybelea sp.]|nr:hypothetical protein [Candidatus Cybelea sp.]
MNPAAWRAAILTLCAIAALSAVTSVFAIVGLGGAPPWSGRRGLQPALASEPFSVRVGSVDPAGPADRAGLRAGDTIDLRTNSLQERYWIAGRPLTGRTLPLLVRRGALQEKVVLVPASLQSIYAGKSWNWTAFLVYGSAFFVQPFLTLWLAFFAALIGWRRSHVPEMRLLALALVVLAISNESNNIEWALPWVWVYVVADFVSDVAFPLAVVLSVAFAGGFARPLSASRRIAQWLCYTIAAISVAQNVAASIGFITLWFDPNAPVLRPQITLSALAISGLACSILAISASRGVERKRLSWTLIPLAILLYLPTLSSYIYLIPMSYFLANLTSEVFSFISFAAPVALTYAALSRRAIDIGFVLSRAVVFTLVSAIVIGLFVLVEWAANAWLTSTTHTANTIIGMVVALGLGISLSYIHKYVDRFVDRVIFRKRYEDEAALRGFAHEASYITDRSTLLERAVRTVKEHTDAENAALLVRDGAAKYVSAGDGGRLEVGENDPGIVALRAWHKALDLHALPDSELRGELAFPMISRGDLVGALICGPKRNGEAYAPDESNALLTLAHGVGTALDTLSSRNDTAIESLRETLALLFEQQRIALAQIVDRQPPPSAAQ